MAPRQIEDAPVRPAVHARRVEEQEVGLVTGLQHPPFLDAEHRSRLAGQPAGSVFQRQHAELAHPVPEQVQPEAGVIEERKMRARVRQRHHAGGVAEHAADRLLVGVEEQRREHRVETFLEGQVEHQVERVLARLSRQLGDRALLELLARRLDHAHLAPLAVEQAEVRRGRKLLTH